MRARVPAAVPRWSLRELDFVLRCDEVSIVFEAMWAIDAICENPSIGDQLLAGLQDETSVVKPCFKDKLSSIHVDMYRATAPILRQPA